MYLGLLLLRGFPPSERAAVNLRIAAIIVFRKRKPKPSGIITDPYCAILSGVSHFPRVFGQSLPCFFVWLTTFIDRFLPLSRHHF